MNNKMSFRFTLLTIETCQMMISGVKLFFLLLRSLIHPVQKALKPKKLYIDLGRSMKVI
jgi:hypothetical protein